MGQITGQPNGRPTLTFSRRRWQESIKACKEMISNPKQPAHVKIRCIELLGMIYGVEQPESRQDKIAVSELVNAHNVDKLVKAAVDKRITDQNADRLAREQEKEQADALIQAQAIFETVLDDSTGF
jgi:hypothetical protein